MFNPERLFGLFGYSRVNPESVKYNPYTVVALDQSARSSREIIKSWCDGIFLDYGDEVKRAETIKLFSSEDPERAAQIVMVFFGYFPEENIDGFVEDFVPAIQDAFVKRSAESAIKFASSLIDLLEQSNISNSMHPVIKSRLQNLLEPPTEEE